MKYISTFEAAKKWGISPRRVLNIVKSGRIPGATQIGTRFMIPENTEKPIDGRTKESKHSTNEGDNFRCPIFEYKDLSSFNPPLSSEEQILKCVSEAFHACRFQEAYNLLGDLPYNAKDKYIRITALYIGCMADIFLFKTKEFFDRYGKLVNELQGDFPHKTEMQEYLHEIDAALGLSNYYVNEFEVRTDYEYHHSFLPHLSAISSIRFAFPSTNLTKSELITQEVNCIYLEQSEAHIYTQATHVYLSAGYVLLGMFDKANYHFNKALIIAEKYELYYIPAEQFYYMKSIFKPSFDGFPVAFKNRFLKICDDVHNRYMQFTDNISKNHVSKLLSHKDYIFIYYAVKGYTNKKISQLLNVSESNIGKRYGEIYSIIGVNSKNELIELYHELVNDSILE